MDTRCVLSYEKDFLIWAGYDVGPQQWHDVINNELMFK